MASNKVFLYEKWLIADFYEPDRPFLGTGPAFLGTGTVFLGAGTAF